MAVTLVRAVLDRRAPLADMGSVQKLFAMIVPMIREEPVGVGVGGATERGEGEEGAEEGKGAAEAEGGEGEGGDGGAGKGGLAPATTLEEEQVGLCVSL